MEDHKVEIKADSIETFKMVEEKLKKLPLVVYNQIDTAYWNRLLNCVECLLRGTIGEKERLYAIPRNVSKIAHFGQFMGIYCPDFFFKIEDSQFQKIKDVQISYIFIDDEEEVSKTRNKKS
jgi:hypothetical protein